MVGSDADQVNAESRANDDGSTRRILVGADGSDRSIEAVNWAIEEAKAHGGEVELVVAWEPPATTIFVTPTFQESDYKDQARAVMEHVLREVDAESRGVRIHPEIAMGSGGDVLVKLSRNADLLVVGSHGLGHGQLPGVHLGSVSSYCVHHSECPTLVVR
jgi:nucleotide-binding universal stress UspA family protein